MKTLKSGNALSSDMLVWMIVASLVMVLLLQKSNDPGPLAITGVSPTEVLPCTTPSSRIPKPVDD